MTNESVLPMGSIPANTARVRPSARAIPSVATYATAYSARTSILVQSNVS